jgi:TolB protein
MSCGLVLVALFPVAPVPPVIAQQSQREVVVDLINSPGYHPRLGLTDPVVTSGDPALRLAATTLADVLWADLEFEREYYLIARKSAAGVPSAATPSTVPVEAWRQLGADFVAVWTLTAEGAGAAVAIQLVSVRPESVGRAAYAMAFEGCTLAAIRHCAHAIADSIHKLTRGLDGVARTNLAFASDRDAARVAGRLQATPGQSKEIYLADYDGANPRRVTANQSLNIAPDWGPGRLLAYVSYASRYPDIYFLTLDGRPPTRPAGGDERIHNTMPAISPDGSRLAFQSTRDSPGYYDIFIVNRDGTGMRNVTPNTPTSSEGAPAWSPSGAQLAFTSDRTGTNQIYILNADGTGVRRITTDRSDAPAWAPQNYLAFARQNGPGHDIAVYDFATDQTRILTNGVGSNKSPSVAPNGRHIAFVTTRWGREQIAVIDLDGHNVRRVTDAGNNTWPTWSPSPAGK